MLRKAEDELENLRDEKSRLETQLGLALSGEEKAKNQLKTYIEGEGDKTKEELETLRNELEQKRRDGEENQAMWKERVSELQKVSSVQLEYLILFSYRNLMQLHPGAEQQGACLQRS